MGKNKTIFGTWILLKKWPAMIIELCTPVVYEYIYCIRWHFREFTLLTSTKVSSSKRQCNETNACGMGCGNLAFFIHSFLQMSEAPERFGG